MLWVHEYVIYVRREESSDRNLIARRREFVGSKCASRSPYTSPLLYTWGILDGLTFALELCRATIVASLIVLCHAAWPAACLPLITRMYLFCRDPCSYGSWGPSHKVWTLNCYFKNGWKHHQLMRVYIHEFGETIHKRRGGHYWFRQHHHTSQCQKMYSHEGGFKYWSNNECYLLLFLC
jgi:hypothetical protein